jgi:hypothetical protein
MLIDGSKINLEYKKFEILDKRKEWKSNKSRWSIVKKTLTDELDEKKTYTAFDPNLVQAYDANLVKFVFLKNHKIFTIHDSFGVDVTNIHLLIDDINKYFNEKLNLTSEYSIFILL